MKKVFWNLLIGVIAIAGILLLIYPHVSFWFEQNHQSYVIQNLDNTLAEVSAEKMQEAWDDAVLYNNGLSKHSIADPFAATLSQPDERYLSMLNLTGNGVMAHIKIPKIQIDLPIYHGTSDSVLEVGIGHLEGTALPVGGPSTHCVLTGHSGLNSAKMFTDIIKLQEGDEFYIYTLDQILAYRVDQIVVVEPSDVKQLAAVRDQDYVTLVTCTPYGINSHRLLVRGERVQYTPEEIEKRIEETKPATSNETLLLYVGIGAPLFLILVVIVILAIRRKRG